MLVEHFAARHAARSGKCIDALEDGVISGQVPAHRPEPSPSMRFATIRAAGVRTAESRRFGGFVPFLLTVAVVACGSAATASTTSGPIVCAPAASRDLHVHLVNEAGAAPRALDAARAEAGRIWASTGLRLTWSAPPVPFDVTDGRTVVVIVRRALRQLYATDARDAHAASPGSLGRLVFGEDDQPGHLIEVSFEALTSLMMHGSQGERLISTLPERARMSLLGRGLGRVVAHEIGHWLMGRGHMREGLMRASFGVRDVFDPDTPQLPRAWTLAGSEQQLALASRFGEAGIVCTP
jgi:hypothetical protein